MRKAKVNINTEKLEVASEIMRALAHPLRLKILHFIDEQGEVTVNQIYHSLNLVTLTLPDCQQASCDANVVVLA